MTDILCKWLNEEVKLSKPVDKATFAQDFASGYYLGEILHKFQLQDDFDAFSVGQTADAKLNNFTRLEPTLHLLQIPFDTNIAYNVMMMKHGIATRLLYQLYVALQRKVKSNLTGAAMETMRASAPVKLEHIESGLYKERLKTLLPRESDLTLDQVSSNFIVKRQLNERKAMAERFREMEAFEKIKQEQRQAALEKSREARHKQTELLAKIQAATVHIPKPPPSKTLKALNQRREIKRKKEAASVFSNIDGFERNLKKLVAPTSSQDDDGVDGDFESSVEYLQRIKNRLEEDSTAREERAKRRRKVLVDQMKAHHAQEEALRQEQVVQRLMRQSQQERRIAVQLMQARREKDTIRKNRIFQEKQNETRRLKDFQDALDKEAELCKLAREDYEEEIKREKERHERIMADRAQGRYRRHYNLCRETLDSIIDFAYKVAEYRELTEKKVPEKLVREWRELTLSGQPLYVEADDGKQVEVELAKEEILDNQDFSEYKNMIGEWLPSEDLEIKPSPTNNNILGHVLHRMFRMVAPTPPPTPLPVFPEFPVRAAVLGKMFAGKSTVVNQLIRNHRIVRLAVDQLLSEAVESFHDGELDETQPGLPLADSINAISSTSITIEPPTPAFDDTGAQKSGGFPSDADEKKKDEEKEVLYDENGVPIHVKKDEPRVSTRAILGQQAMEFLRRGEPVPDAILVEVLVMAIRKIPDGTGWVLDGFPSTAQQGVLLEKALTGNDVSVEATSMKRKASKKSSLVMDPKPTKEPPPAPCGLDAIIVLDLDDQLVLKRASGRTEAKQAGETYHAEFRPPPPGSQTGYGNAEQVFPMKDVAFDREQVQHRISSFHDNWPRLEKLYNQISVVRHVDAEADLQTVFTDLERSLFETLDKIQNKGSEVVVNNVDADKESQPAPPPVEKVEPPRPDSAVSKKSKRSSQSPDSKSRSPKGSARGRKKSGDKSEKGKSRSRSGSGKSSKSKKKSRSPTPLPEPEPPAEEVVGPPLPQPGDPDWLYVDEELPLTLAHACVPYWENTEKNYMKMSKFMFRQVRAERESIIRYLYEIRKDFSGHLRRPDHKQIFVTSWQNNYNEMADDLRPDEESKAELHQRLDDLRERLWDICDTRKEQIETERGNLMTEGWIEDHLGVLTNHYLTLMQAEIDRFQDTTQILKDYYGGMQAKIPVEVGAAGTFIRLPLVELDVGGQDISATQSALTFGSESPSVSPQASQMKTAKKSTEEISNERSDEGANLAESASRTKIPLVQRGAVISSQAGDDGGKGKKGKGPAPPPQGADSPSHEENLEEKTITEAFNFAANVVTTTVQSRISEKEAEEEEERRLKEEEERAKAAQVPSDKKAAGGKKGGGKSAKGKKGKGGKSKSPTPTPPTPVEEESEEDKRKRENAVRLRDEYFAALQQEEGGVKDRLELIRSRASRTLTDLRHKSEQTFADMNDWLGARYLREMAAVDALSNVARHHIENAQTLKTELRLDQDEFVINSERKVVRTPSPPPRPPPVETAQPDVFTVVQLANLHAHFKEVAPGGIIINKAFIELLADTAALTHGLDALPDMWMNVSYSQLVDLCGLLSHESEYIDWRKFLLLAAQPWPKPTSEQLQQMRNAFTDVDVAGNGWITEDQYKQVELWFPSSDERPSSPDDAEEPYPYNRNRNLRDFFFTLFSDWEQMPPRLDYVNMLIYFAVDRDYVAGFFRALGVGAGQLMPRFAREASQAPDKDVTPEDAIASDSSPAFPASSNKGMQPELELSPASMVSPEVWWLVLHHGSSRLGDSHRFSVSEDPEDKYSMDRLRDVYSELESTGDTLPIQTLVRHPVLQDAVSSTRRHHCPDIRSIFVRQALQALENDEIQSDSAGFS